MLTTLSTKLKFLLLFLFLVNMDILSAQTKFSAGFLPSINYNQKIKKDWDINFRFESRHFVFENKTPQSEAFKYQYSLSDFSALVGRKVGLNAKLVLGGLVRIEPGALVFRSIQQFIFQGNIASSRVAHRIAADQTFSSKEFPELRLRYRLSAEIPLSGQKVDMKEFYFKFNVETLNSLENKEYDLEFRIVPHFGYVINEQHKIEFGLDNRFNSFINRQAYITSWLAVNWFF
jgi:hypothetical protein